MNVPAIRAELESEWTWRANEIRFFKNVGAKLPGSPDRDQFRRALVLLLYAHFEGFCKAALLTYVSAVNSEGEIRADVRTSLATSSFYEEFRLLANSNHKPVSFSVRIENDSELQRFGRERNFLESLDAFWSKSCAVPDSVVDTESNLSDIVLRKNLFRLGFPAEIFAAHDGSIQHLLRRRNNIAHGADKAGLEEKKYLELEAAVSRIANALIILITDYLREKLYLKKSTVVPSFVSPSVI